jgi:stage II sporulation protein D
MDIIMPVRDSRMLINSDSFYLRVRFIARGNELLAVNILPMSRYLYGVVTGELGHSEYIEALKAQAVAARSFAVYELKSRASQPFHVRRTTQSQVFASKEKYPIRVIKAVDATRGIVLTFSNRLIKAYYSSTCGGKSASIDDVWDCLPQVPFASVPCTYCRESKYYTWQYRISKSELRRVLLDEGYRVGTVKDIVIPKDGAGRSGRIRYLKIIVDEKSHNGVIILSGIRFRGLLNRQEEKLKSTWFEVHAAKNMFIFSGHGYGHGVGMCQIGAEGQARSGKTFSDILSHYYSGISLIRIY